MANKQYFAEGTICIDAEGYWHSSGGAKNNFGYIPHLRSIKNAHLPVYPDTQILNVLRVAAKIYKKLYNNSISIDKIFGKEGNTNTQGLLKVGDLELTDCEKWSDERYEIKPRIKISRTKHVVENKMLGFHELANLSGCKLSAPIYIGPFKTEEQCLEIKNFLDKAIKYSFGLGAFKSRGCGNGSTSIKWADMHVCSPDLKDENRVTRLKYLLKSVVNFRNKDVAANDRQHIPVKNCITSTQIYGWFMKTYYSVFGEWPISEEVSSISFNNLYPGTEDEQYYPAPLTTKEVEPSPGEVKGRIYDSYGLENTEKSKDEQHADVSDRVKERNLNSNQFVTDSNKPKILTCMENLRMRNSMLESFVTKKNGLFSQDFISAGTYFSGCVTIDSPESKFGQRAQSILNSMYVTIGGCIFTPVGLVPNEVNKAGNCSGHLVVTETPPLGTISESSFFESGVVSLDVAKRYNTMLKRPKRNKIVFAAGSVLNSKPQCNDTVSWNGFGQSDFESLSEQKVSGSTVLASGEVDPPISDLVFPVKMTRSQRGFFRGLLTPSFDFEIIKRTLKGCKGKFENRGDSGKDLAQVFEKLAALENGDEFKRQVKYMLDEYTLKEYERNRRGATQHEAC